MCIVSAVIDYGQRIPSDQWTIPGIRDFNELVRRGQQFDRINGQPNCEDPEKAKLLKKLELLEQKIKLIDQIKRIKDNLSQAEADLAIVERAIEEI